MGVERTASKRRMKAAESSTVKGVAGRNMVKSDPTQRRGESGAATESASVFKTRPAEKDTLRWFKTMSEGDDGGLTVGLRQATGTQDGIVTRATCETSLRKHGREREPGSASWKGFQRDLRKATWSDPMQSGLG